MAAPWTSVPEVGPGVRELKVAGEVGQEETMGCEQGEQMGGWWVGGG